MALHLAIETRYAFQPESLQWTFSIRKWKLVVFKHPSFTKNSKYLLKVVVWGIERRFSISWILSGVMFLEVQNLDFLYWLANQKLNKNSVGVLHRSNGVVIIFPKHNNIICKKTMGDFGSRTTNFNSLPISLWHFFLNKEGEEFHAENKIYRERGSLCLIPLEGWKKFEGSPFTIISIDTEQTQLRMSSIFRLVKN